MPVALHHVGLAVNFLGQRSFHDLGRPRSEPHARAFAVNFFALLLEQRNHRVGRLGIELRAIGLLNSTNVSREFDCRHLHAEAKAEIRNSMLARITRRLDFSFDAALAEPARNQNSGDIFQLCAHSVLE